MCDGAQNVLLNLATQNMQMTSVLAENPVLQLSDLHTKFTKVMQEPLLCQ